MLRYFHDDQAYLTGVAAGPDAAVAIAAVVTAGIVVAVALVRTVVAA